MVNEHAPILLYMFGGLTPILIVALGFLFKSWMNIVMGKLKEIHECQEGLRTEIHHLDRRLTRVEAKIGLVHPHLDLSKEGDYGD